MRTVLIISLVIIILSYLIGFALAPSLPEDIPSHWNLQGNVDGYMSKDIGLHFLPVFTLVIMALMVILPRYDPETDRYASFQPAYDGLILLVVIFLTVLYQVSLLWAYGTRISMNSLMAVMFSLLFIGIGCFFRSVKKTWFVGIRTPWTLLSERVWEKTHQTGSWLFILSGILCLGGIFYPLYTYLFVLYQFFSRCVGYMSTHTCSMRKKNRQIDKII